MYLTAHLVRATDREGVNAFLHLHGAGFPWPGNPAGLADSDPGETVEKAIDLPPGGNAVRAYLDILAPDGTDRAAIRRSLDALSRNLSSLGNPSVFHHEHVTIRFGVELGLALLAEQYLSMLVRAALAVFDAWRARAP